MSTLENVAEVPIIRPRWLNITEEPVVSVQFLNETLVLAGLGNGEVRCLDFENGQTLATLAAHQMGLLGIVTKPQSFEFVTLGEDNRISHLQFLDGQLKPVRSWKSKQWVEQALWVKDDLYFSSGKNLFLWKAGESEPQILETWSHSLSSLKLNNRGELGVVGYSRFTVYDLNDFSQSAHFEWKGSLENLQFCARNRFAACSSNDLSIHIWDLKKNKDLAMRGFPQKILDMSFRSDGLYLANCSGEEVMIWDFMDPGPGGKKPQVLGPFEKNIQLCQYQHKGKMLATFGADGVVLFWRPDLFDDHPIAIAGIRDQAIMSARWSPDDTEVLTGLSTGYVACYPAPQVKDT